VLYPWNRVSVLFPVFIFLTTIDIPALIVIGWWFIQQFLYGFLALSETAAGGVAFWAHIGGFIGGAVLILPFFGRRRTRPRAYYTSTPTSPF
jgi:membrane associated rhomboid family serine protease